MKRVPTRVPMLGAMACLLAVMALSATASADEVIQLLDKTRITGKLVHFYDGMLSLKLPSGTVMKLPANKVVSIRFSLPPPRAALSSPAKTFKRLRRAALKGDLDTYIDCHSSYYQMFLGHQVAMAKPAKFARRLKKEWGDIQLEVLGTTIKGDTALMKVRRKKGGQSQDGELRFVKENGEWKMILPL